VFRATGGTNIEAALNDIVTRLTKLSAEVSTAVVWFLTDGEETVYFNSKNQPDSIPRNPKLQNYAFYNVEDISGVTPYQKSLISYMEK